MFLFFYACPLSGLIYVDKCKVDTPLARKTFRKAFDVPSCNVRPVTGSLPLGENAEKRLLAQMLWAELGDVPTSDDGTDGKLDEPFLFFEAGTDVYEVWEWFEDAFDLSVAADLMFKAA
jgi:hypothetical protein